MKLALPVFAVAMGLFFAALAVPFPREDNRRLHPLDLAGVETVVVEGDGGARVEFSPGLAPRAETQGDPQAQVRAVRRGHTLFITAAGSEGAMTVWLRLPPAVRRIEMASGDVTTGREARLEALDLRVRGPVDFKGDAGRLRITSLAGAQDCKGRYCPGIGISSGRIDDLVVRSESLVVHLEEPDDLGRVHLVLGPGARVRVGDARRLDHIRIERVARVTADTDTKDAIPPEASE